MSISDFFSATHHHYSGVDAQMICDVPVHARLSPSSEVVIRAVVYRFEDKKLHAVAWDEWLGTVPDPEAAPGSGLRVRRFQPIVGE